MRARFGRVLGACLPALLLSAAVGLISPAARAGEFYSSVLCGDAADILAFFAENSDFSGLDNCESLCKKAHAKCKEYLAKSKSCEKATVNDDNFFGKEIECDPIPDQATRKECRQSFNDEAKDTKDEINTEEDLAKDECLAIRDACIEDCSAVIEATAAE